MGFEYFASKSGASDDVRVSLVQRLFAEDSAFLCTLGLIVMKIQNVGVIAITIVGGLVGLAVYKAREHNVPGASAERAVLRAYPDVLRNAKFGLPYSFVLDSTISGTAQKGAKVWAIQVSCNKGGHHARFIVVDHSDEIIESIKPGGPLSIRCD